MAKLFSTEEEEQAALQRYADYINGYGLNQRQLTNLPVEGIHEYNPGYTANEIIASEDRRNPKVWFPSYHAAQEEARIKRETGWKPGRTYNTLSGTVREGPEREQTWAERMVRSGVSLPTDVMAGTVLSGPGLRAGDYSDIPMSPVSGTHQPLANLIERAQDTAGLAAGGSVAATGLKAEKPGVLARGATKLKDKLKQFLAEDAEAGKPVNPYTTDAYHGTLNFEGDKIDIRPSDEIPKHGSYGFYSTNDPVQASTHGSQVMPLKLDTKDYHVVDVKGKNWTKNWDELNNKAIDEGLANNKKGVILKNVDDKNNVYITFNPETVRSRFAKFDPDKYGKSGLMLSDNEAGTGLSAARNANPYTTDAYHGTSEFKGHKILKLNEEEFYALSHPEEANKWASANQDITGKSSVLPLKLDTKNYHVVEVNGGIKEYAKLQNSGIEEAIKLGKKGVVFKNATESQGVNPEGQNIYVAIDPGTVRGKFAKMNEADFGKSGLMLEDDIAGTAVSSLSQRLHEHLGTQESMPQILARQRASEGYEAAIRDSETKQIYSGMWHEEVIDKIAKERGVPRSEINNLVSSPEKGNLVKGYINDRGRFLTEDAVEKLSQAKSKSKTAMFRSDDIVGTGLAAAAEGGKSAAAPRFYNHVENVINEAKTMVRNAEGKRVEVPQEKFNANELNAYLKNKGVTNEEMEALKIPEFLEGKKSISKKELLDHINENKVELKESWSGESPQSKELKTLEQKKLELRTKIHETMDIKKENKLVAELNQVEEKIKAIPNQPDFKPRFAQYQLPGGSNYRELLLSVKDNPKKLQRVEEINNEINQIRVKEQSLKKDLLSKVNTEADAIKRKQAEDSYNELKEKKYALAGERLDLEQAFTHEHWPGAKDVFAHSRMNDRFIPDEMGPSVNPIQRDKSAQDLIKDWGYTKDQWKALTKEQRNKILDEHQNDLGPKGLNSLHAEEFQSDVHQQGHTEGYKLPRAIQKKLEPEFDRIEEKIVASGDEAIMSNPELKDAIKSAVDKKIITEAEAKTYLRYSDHLRSGAVKELPFKNTWLDLKLKRLIRQAAEEGKDAISWTPGQAQADRYNLRKHVDQIEYMKNEDGTIELELKGKNGENIPTSEKYYTKDNLHRFIGKEMAAKIIKDEGKKSGNKSILEGEDLEVGGEFHKRLYDEIAVSKANAIAKKYGGKVEEKEISILDNDPNMRKIAEAVGDKTKQKIWVLKLTPELKKAALERGFSMFETGLPLPTNNNEQNKYRLVPVSHNPFVNPRLM